MLELTAQSNEAAVTSKVFTSSNPCMSMESTLVIVSLFLALLLCLTVIHISVSAEVSAFSSGDSWDFSG